MKLRITLDLATAAGISTVRAALGQSQAEFAESVGVSRRSVAGWELGTSTPGASNVEAIHALARARLVNRRASHASASAPDEQTSPDGDCEPWMAGKLLSNAELGYEPTGEGAQSAAVVAELVKLAKARLLRTPGQIGISSEHQSDAAANASPSPVSTWRYKVDAREFVWTDDARTAAAVMWLRRNKPNDLIELDPRGVQ